MSIDPVLPPQQPKQEAPNAVTALVLGICSIVICPLIGPFAWSLGANAEKAVDASGGQLGGRGMATAGKILGIIGTVLIALFLLFILLAVATSGG